MQGLHILVTLAHRAEQRLPYGQLAKLAPPDAIEGLAHDGLIAVDGPTEPAPSPHGQAEVQRLAKAVFEARILAAAAQAAEPITLTKVTTVTGFFSVADRAATAQSLIDRGFLQPKAKKRLALTEPGRALLEKCRPGLDDNAVRLLHWLVRRGKPAKSSQIPATIGSAAEVATWLDALSGQGLILRKVKPAATTPVRLTSRGNEVLAKLAEALVSLRGGEKAVSSPERSAQPEPEQKPKPEPASDDRILAIIGDLDRQHNSGNYLPIFHLRESFPDLAREDLDSALMRLSRGKKISLSSLQESRDYTPNQVDSGIPQRIGGPLFFIRLR